jgi:lysophospholipase L1-like esterase
MDPIAILIRKAVGPLARLALPLAFLSPAMGDPTTPNIPARSPLVRIEGRTADGASGRVRMGYPGITIHLRCEGGDLAMVLDAAKDQNYFDVAVDGGAPARLRASAGVGSYPLLGAASGGGVHEVVVTRRTESWQGTCDLLGFSAGASTRLLPPAPGPARRLLFIGDSVTCGEFAAWNPDDPLNGKTPNSEHITDAAQSYGYLLARRLGADCSLVAYGGRGIVRDWQGITDTNNAPQFYELAMPDDPSTLWDHAAYVPQAIGIGLGTNDFSRGIPDQTTFVNAYVEFLRKVRRDAPGAWIFLLESPILADAEGQPPKRAVLRAYLGEVLRRMADARILLAPVRHYPGVPGNGHPLASEQRSMADEIEPLLRRALGW